MIALAIERWQDGCRTAGQDLLAEEVPVALEYNGIGHAVMLASPADLEDFALGFSLSEGIVDTHEDVLGMEVDVVPTGIRLALHITGGCFARLRERRRLLAGRTGCGLCGVDSLDQVRRPLRAVTAPATLDAAALQRALGDLGSHQPVQRQTGATHAAAWLAGDGSILCAREDVGRHNALDKLIGALVGGGFDPHAGFALVTSRASFEMVQKAASAGVPLLAAVSAPTGYAIRLAAEVGLTLAGFVRAGRHALYSHPERISD